MGLIMGFIEGVTEEGVTTGILKSTRNVLVFGACNLVGEKTETFIPGYAEDFFGATAGAVLMASILTGTAAVLDHVNLKKAPIYAERIRRRRIGVSIGAVLAFGIAYEILQAKHIFNFGRGDWKDTVAYAGGCALFFAGEKILNRVKVKMPLRRRYR